jgi:hypothetical protein
MDKQQLKQAIELAHVRHIPFSETNLHLFNGYGLQAFEPLHCTLADIADLIRWQAFKFNGELDTSEINQIARIGRSKFHIVG